MHPLKIHSYSSCSYRDPENLEDVWIRIVVVLCTLAKVLGMQYTKRLLPDFLIPDARVRLDKVVEPGRRNEEGSTLEECCGILGCTDLRTARKHVEKLEEAVKAVALSLPRDRPPRFIFMKTLHFSVPSLLSIGWLSSAGERKKRR